MSTTTIFLQSAAHLAASLQAPYARIGKAIEALKISAAVSLNGIAHFDESQCEQIAAFLARKEQPDQSGQVKSK